MNTNTHTNEPIFDIDHSHHQHAVTDMSSSSYDEDSSELFYCISCMISEIPELAHASEQQQQKRKRSTRPQHTDAMKSYSVKLKNKTTKLKTIMTGTKSDIKKKINKCISAMNLIDVKITHVKIDDATDDNVGYMKVDNLESSF